METAEKREFSLEELGGFGRDKKVICELKSDFYPYQFVCENCGYGSKGETDFWYGFCSSLPENCFIIICLKCEKILFVDIA